MKLLATVLVFTLSLDASVIKDQACYNDSNGSVSTITTNYGRFCNEAGSCSGTATSTTAGALVFCNGTAVASGVSMTDPSSQTYHVASNVTPSWQRYVSYIINSASIASTTMNTNFGGDILQCVSFIGDAAGSTTAFDSACGNCSAGAAPEADTGFNGGTASGVNLPTVSTGTLTQAYNLVIEACGNQTDNNITITYTAGAGWTAGENSADDANVFYQWKVVNSTASVSGTGTFSGNGAGYQVSCTIVPFKITAVASPAGSSISGGFKATAGTKIQ
jgi:hypothetical protein